QRRSPPIYFSIMVNEASDGAFRADGPTVQRVENGHGVETKRVDVLPVCTAIRRKFFAARPNGYPTFTLDVGYSRTQTAGLLGSKFPGLSSVERISSDAFGIHGFFIVAAQSNQTIASIEAQGKNSR